MAVKQVADTSLRFEPLWVRVDRNRLKLALFVSMFVGGSAALLSLALVAVPGYLIAWGLGAVQVIEGTVWIARLPWVVLATFGGLLAIGGLLAAIQLANAEDWVRSRFRAVPLEPDRWTGTTSAVEDMSIAAGLGAPPALLVLDSDAINACAIGTSRRRPTIGVTRGFLSELDEGEQRAVLATLVARIGAGDILFGTALAALLGPLKAVRGSGQAVSGAGACLSGGCGDGCNGCGNLDGCGNGCGDGCSSLGDIGDLTDSDSAGGCLVVIGVGVFLAVVAAVTYGAVLTAAWIVTLWGRALDRQSYEKADAEGMLLLKDPKPMLSALTKTIAASNTVGDGDFSYDGIFYVPTSGTTRIEPDERRRLDRLREVLGVEGAQADASAPPR
jgi:Zn-dependent protease with chaperone function